MSHRILSRFQALPKQLLGFFLLALHALPASAAIYTSAVPAGNFHQPATWRDADGNAPGTISASDTFRIQAGHAIAVTAATSIRVAVLEVQGSLSIAGTFAALQRLSSAAGSQIQLPGGTLEVPAEIALQGGYDFSGGTVQYTRAADGQAVIPGVYRVLLLDGGSKTAAGNLEVRQALSPGGTRFDLGTRTMTVTGELRGTAAQYVLIQGTVRYTATVALQELFPAEYGRLELSGQPKRLISSLSVRTHLQLDAPLGLANQTLTLLGSVAVGPDVAINWTSGTVKYAGADQTMLATDYDRLHLEGTGRKTLRANASVSGELLLRAGFRLNGGTFQTPGCTVAAGTEAAVAAGRWNVGGSLVADGTLRSADTVSIAGNLTIGTAGRCETTAGVLFLEGNLANNRTCLIGGTLSFAGDANATISGQPLVAHRLEVAKANAGLLVSVANGSARITADTTLLTLGALSLGTFTNQALGVVKGTADGRLRVEAANNTTLQWPNGDYSQAGEIVLVAEGPANYSIPLLPDGSPFPSIAFSDGRTKTLLAPIEVRGNLSLSRSTTLNSGGFPITIYGSWREVGPNDVFLHQGAPVIWAGTGVSTIGSAAPIAFGPIRLQEGKTVLLEVSVQVEGDVYLEAGSTLDLERNNLSWSGRHWEEESLAGLSGNGRLRVFADSAVALGESPMQCPNLDVMASARFFPQLNLQVLNQALIAGRVEMDTFLLSGGQQLSFESQGLLRIGGPDNFPRNFPQSNLNAGTIEYYHPDRQQIAGTSHIRSYHILLLTGGGLKVPEGPVAGFRMRLDHAQWEQDGGSLSWSEDILQSENSTFNAQNASVGARDWLQSGPAILDNVQATLQGRYDIGPAATALYRNSTLALAAGPWRNQGVCSAEQTSLSIAQGSWENLGSVQWPDGAVSAGGDAFNAGTCETGSTQWAIGGDWRNSGTFQAGTAQCRVGGGWHNLPGGTFAPGQSRVRFVGPKPALIDDADRNTGKFSFWEIWIDKDSLQYSVATAPGTIVLAEWMHWLGGTLALANTDAGSLQGNHLWRHATVAGANNNTQVALQLQANAGTTAQWPQGNLSSTYNSSRGIMLDTRFKVVYAGNQSYTLPSITPCYPQLLIAQGGNTPKIAPPQFCVRQSLWVGRGAVELSSPATLQAGAGTSTTISVSLNVYPQSTARLLSDARWTIQTGSAILYENASVLLGQDSQPDEAPQILLQDGDWRHDAGNASTVVTANGLLWVRRGSMQGEGLVQAGQQGRIQIDRGHYARQGNTRLLGKGQLELRAGNMQENSLVGSDSARVVFSGTDSAQYILPGTYNFSLLDLRKEGQDLLLASPIRVSKGLFLNTFQPDGQAFSTAGGLLRLQTHDLTLSAGAQLVGLNGATSKGEGAREAFSAQRMLACDPSPFSGKLWVEGDTASRTLEGFYPLGAASPQQPEAWQYTPLAIESLRVGLAGNPAISLRTVPYDAPPIDLIPRYWEVRTQGIVPIEGAQLRFFFDPAEWTRTDAVLTALRYEGGKAYAVQPFFLDEANGQFGTDEANTFIEGDWRLGTEDKLPKTYYAYQSGLWNDPATWTQDPTGLTQPAADIAPLQARGGGPDLGDYVFVVNGREVEIAGSDAPLQVSYTALQDGQLALGNGAESHYLGTVVGAGTLVSISNPTLPKGNYDRFVGEQGGTVVFITPHPDSTTTILAEQTQGRFRNLRTEGPGTTVLAQSYTVSGDFEAQNGRVFLQNSQEVLGDVRIGPEVRMAAANNATARLSVHGNMDIEGRWFGNTKAYPDYGPTTRRLQLRLAGSADAQVLVSGFARFDQIWVDKANPDAVVSLLGAHADSVQFNNQLRSASAGNQTFLLTSGTLRLQAPLRVPALTAGAFPLRIGEQAGLWIDGAQVQLATRPDTLLLPAALEVRGLLRLSAGSLNAAGGPGLYFADDDETLGQGGVGGWVWVEGGQLSAPALFAQRNQTGDGDGYGHYRQTGGTVVLTGAASIDGQVPYATLSMTSPSSRFEMSGGTLRLEEATSGRLAWSNMPAGQLRIEGGHWELLGQGNWLWPEVHRLSLLQDAQLRAQAPLSLQSDLASSVNTLLIMGAHTLSLQGNAQLQGRYASSGTTQIIGTQPQQIFGFDTLNALQIGPNAQVAWQSPSLLRGNVGVEGRVGLQRDWRLLAELLQLDGAVEGSGFVRMQGTQAQRIDTDGTAALARLSIQNTQGVTLAGDLRLSQALDLSQGQLRVGGQRLTLLPGTQLSGEWDSGTRLALGQGTVAQQFDGPGTVALPIGSANHYSPLTLTALGGTSGGEVAVGVQETAAPGLADAMPYHWQLARQGLNGSVLQAEALYPASLLPDAAGYQAALLQSDWQFGAPQAIDPDRQALAFSGISGELAWLTAARGTAPEIPTLYSRASGAWHDPSTWSAIGHDGPAAGSVPGANTRVRIGAGHAVQVAENDARAGFLRIALGSQLDVGRSTGHHFGVYETTPGEEEGQLRISSAQNDAAFPGGDWQGFLGADGGTVVYADPSQAPNSFFRLPASPPSYRHLVLAFVAEGDDHRIWLPETGLQVLGNLTVADQRAVIFNFNGGEVRQYGSVWVGGNVLLEGGAEWRFQPNASHSLTVMGHWIQAGNWTLLASDGRVHEVYLYGNLTNNGLLQAQTGLRFHLVGAQDAVVTGQAFGTSGSEETTFRQLIVDKSDGATVVFSDPKFRLLPYTWGGTTASPHSLVLTRGTARFTAAADTLVLSTAASTYDIPSAASLELLGVSAELPNSGLRLAGLLRGQNQYLGISGALTYAGTPLLQLEGSQWAIGQWLAPAANAVAALRLYQQGGVLAIGGQLAEPMSDPVLAIGGSGSVWQMDGGVLSIQRSNRSASSSAIRLLPEQSAFSQAPQLRVGSAETSASLFLLEADRLPSLLIAEASDGGHRVQAQRALDVQGPVRIPAQGALLMQGYRLAIGGGFANLGEYLHGNNLTASTGQGDQIWEGTFDLYDWQLEGAGTVWLGNDAAVRHLLSLQQGVLDDGGHTLTIYGNLSNIAQHRSPQATGGLVMLSDKTQTIAGSGRLGHLALNNASNISLPDGHRLDGRLDFRNGNLLLGSQALYFGETATVAGANAQRMVVTSGRASDAGVWKDFAAGPIDFAWPIGDGRAYTPLRLVSGEEAQGSGRVGVVRVGKAHPAAQAGALAQYWRIQPEGLGQATFSQFYGYAASQWPAGFSEEEAVAARLFDGEWQTGSAQVGQVLAASYQIEVQPNGAPAAFLEGDYTAGVPAAFSEVPAFRSRQSGPWEVASTWERRSAGVWQPAAAAPLSGGVVLVQEGHEVAVAESTSLSISDLQVEGTLDLGVSKAHDVTTLRGEGTLRLSSTELPAGNLQPFTGPSGGTVAYEGNGKLPTRTATYRHLEIGGSTVADQASLQLYGDLRIRQNATLQAQGTWRMAGDWRQDGVLDAPQAWFVLDGNDAEQRIEGQGEATLGRLTAREQAGRLALAANLRIEDRLDIAGDTVLLEGAWLRMAGQLAGEGYWQASGGAVLQLEGLGSDAGTWHFLPQSALQRFVLNRPGGQAGLSGHLRVADSIQLRQGTWQWTNASVTADGPIEAEEGRLEADCGSQLYLTDTQGRWNGTPTALPFSSENTQIGGLHLQRNAQWLLSGSVTVCDSLVFGQGLGLLAEGSALRVLGHYVAGSGQWAGHPGADVALANAGRRQDAWVWASGAQAQLRNLTIDRQAGFVYEMASGGDTLALHGTLLLASGSHLDVREGRTLRLLGLVEGNGALRGDASTYVELGGENGGAMGRLRFEEGFREVHTLRLARSGSNAKATLGSALAVQELLWLQQGTLALDDELLTLRGTHWREPGSSLEGGSEAQLEIRSAESLRDALVFTGGTAGQRLNRLLLDQQGSTALASALEVVGELRLEAGVLALAADSLPVSRRFVLSGTFRRASGLLRGHAWATMAIRGTGALGDALVWQEGAQVVRRLQLDRQQEGRAVLGSDLRVGLLDGPAGRLDMTSGTLDLAGYRMVLALESNGFRRQLGHFGGHEASVLTAVGSGSWGDAVSFSTQNNTLRSLMVQRNGADVPLASPLQLLDELQLAPEASLRLNGHALRLNGTPTALPGQRVGLLAGEQACGNSVLWIGQAADGNPYASRPMDSLRLASPSFFRVLRIDNAVGSPALVGAGVQVSVCDTLELRAGSLALGGAPDAPNTWWIGGDTDADGQVSPGDGRPAYIVTSPEAPLRGSAHSRLALVNGQQGLGEAGPPLCFAPDAALLEQLWIQRRLGDAQLGQVTLGSALQIGQESASDGLLAIRGGELVLGGQRLELFLKEDGFVTLPYSPANAPKSLIRGDAQAQLRIGGVGRFNAPDMPVMFRWHVGNDTSLNDIGSLPVLESYLSLARLEIDRQALEPADAVHWGTSLQVREALLLTRGYWAMPGYTQHANGDLLTLRGRLERPDPAPDLMADTLGGRMRGHASARLRIAAGTGPAALFMDDVSGVANAHALRDLEILRAGPVSLRTALRVSGGRLLLADGAVLALQAHAPDSLSPKFLDLGVPLSDLPGFRGVLSGSYRSDLRLFGPIAYNRLRFAPGTARLRTLELQGTTSRALLQLTGALEIGAPEGAGRPEWGLRAFNGRLHVYDEGGLRLNGQRLDLHLDSMGLQQRNRGRLFGDAAARIRVDGPGDAGDPMVFDADAALLDTLEVARHEGGLLTLGSALQIGNASSAGTSHLRLEDGALALAGRTLTLYGGLGRMQGAFRGDERATLLLEGRGAVEGIFFEQDTLPHYQLKLLEIRRTADARNVPTPVPLGSRVRLGTSGGAAPADGLLLAEGAVLALGGQELQLQGDWGGEGVLAADAAGTLTLLGTGPLSNPLAFAAGADTLGRLQLRRGGSFALGTSLQLAGTEADTALVLEQGHLLTDEAAFLTLLARAEVAGGDARASGARPGSYVEGPVAKVFDQAPARAFRLPLGDGGALGELGIDSLSGYPAVVRARYHAEAHPRSEATEANIFNQPAQSPHYLNRVSDAGWWDVSGVSEDRAARLVLPWEAPGLSPNAGQLVVAQEALPGPKWQSLGQSAVVAEAAGGDVRARRLLSEAGAVAVGARDLPGSGGLPAYNLQFSAVWEPETGIVLRWTTQGQLRTAGFVLRRAVLAPSQLADWASYETDASLLGKGTTLETTAYSYVDPEAGLLPGATYYYQLVQAYDDGVQVPYAVVSVQLDAELSLAQPYPNPAREVVNLQFSLQREGQVRLELLDVAGRYVGMVAEGRMDRGTYLYALGTRHLPSGVYLVRLFFDNQVRVARLVLE